MCTGLPGTPSGRQTLTRALGVAAWLCIAAVRIGSAATALPDDEWGRWRSPEEVGVELGRCRMSGFQDGVKATCDLRRDNHLKVVRRVLEIR